MKAYWRSGGIAPRIIDLGTRCEVSGQLHDPVVLPPGKCPCYPLDRRLGGPCIDRLEYDCLERGEHMRVYPEVSELAAWSENANGTALWH
jgi:hypothetical protein